MKRYKKNESVTTFLAGQSKDGDRGIVGTVEAAVISYESMCRLLKKMVEAKKAAAEKELRDALQKREVEARKKANAEKRERERNRKAQEKKAFLESERRRLGM